MASLSSFAGGQDASATELDANLKAAAFPELQRKCTELKIDFEPSIDSELVHIEPGSHMVHLLHLHLGLVHWDRHAPAPWCI